MEKPDLNVSSELMRQCANVYIWMGSSDTVFRLAVACEARKKDDQQGGEHVPGGSSSAVHVQLQRVAGLRLVQLPRCRQDVPAQHAPAYAPSTSLPTRSSLHGQRMTQFAVAVTNHSSTHTTLRSSPTRSTSSTTSRGAGTAAPSRSSSKLAANATCEFSLL